MNVYKIDIELLDNQLSNLMRLNKESNDPLLNGLENLLSLIITKISQTNSITLVKQSGEN